MLARFRKLPALFLDFVEQAHVFDRDDGLVREGGGQLDLLFGERLNPESRRITMTPIDVPLPEHRHCEDRPMLSPPCSAALRPILYSESARIS